VRDKDQQEMRAVAEKPHDVVVKFDTYRNLQRHRASFLSEEIVSTITRRTRLVAILDQILI